MDQIRDLLWPGVRAIAAKYPDQWKWNLSIDDLYDKMMLCIVDGVSRKELSATLLSHEEIDDNCYKGAFVPRLTAVANAFETLTKQSP
jgi:hypothetical protein